MLYVLLALGVLLGGCGGSDDSGEGSAASEAVAGQGGSAGSEEGGGGAEGRARSEGGEAGEGAGSSGRGGGRTGEGEGAGSGGSGSGRGGEGGNQPGRGGNRGGSGGGAGEGGGGPGGSGVPGGVGRVVPKSEFAEQADEICEKRTQEMVLRAQYYVKERKDEGAGKSVGALQAEAVDRVFIPNVEEQVKALRELDLPQGEEEAAEDFIAAMREGIRTTERNTYTAANVEQLGREFHRANQRARVLGIDSCGFGA
jgi:hypothetical protein